MKKKSNKQSLANQITIKEIIKNSKLEHKTAEYILSTVFNIKREDIILNKTIAFDCNKFLNIASKILNGEPPEYAMMKCKFCDFNFTLSKHTLIPRLETEFLVQKAVEKLQNTTNLHILDICSGSGCIGISLAKILNCHASLIEISEDAMQIAIKNAIDLNVTNINFYIEDILTTNSIEKFCDPQKTNIIISNPPYIKTKDIPTLEESVKNFEPLIALDGGEDGIVFYKKIINLVRQTNLINLAIFEVGYDLYDNLQILEDEKSLISFEHDLSGNLRIMTFSK